MKIALVHDHLNQAGGAEVVLDSLLSLYPDSPVHTLLYDEDVMGDLFGHQDIRPSFLQSIPFSKRFLKWMLPLMPTATETYDLSYADVVISSSSAFSKGIITPQNATHICYCHTPTRYLWMDSAGYIKAQKAPKFIKKLLPFLLTYLRIWDRNAADRVDYFVANSQAVSKRIARYYRRESTVIYPPVDVHKYSCTADRKDYILAGGRLVNYKRIDLVIDACNTLGKTLKIFGNGPEMDELKDRAGDTVEFLGRVSEEEKIKLFEEASMYIHPQEEDFGITAVEAMAAGTPVVAYGLGGALETVKDGETGTLFTEQSVQELCNAIQTTEQTTFSSQAIKAHAEQFSVEQFHRKIHAFVTQVCGS